LTGDRNETTFKNLPRRNILGEQIRGVMKKKRKIVVLNGNRAERG